jgi:hypothetical protein
LYRPPKGHHHQLVIYTSILNRWWRAILDLGIVLLLLVAALTWLPGFFHGYESPKVSSQLLWLTAGVGLFAVFIGLLLLAIRRSAFVQPFNDRLRLVTPFLRLDISYGRIRQASSTEMGKLFPPKKFKGWQRDFLRSLSGLTAIVLEMDNLPVPRWLLDLFLAPFFFPDKTARMALLVPDWMKFSNEMESFRSAWLESLRKPERSPQSEILASFSDKQ